MRKTTVTFRDYSSGRIGFVVAVVEKVTSDHGHLGPWSSREVWGFTLTDALFANATKARYR